MKSIRQKILLFMLITVFLVGCSSGDIIGGGWENEPPTADAGADQVVNEQIQVTLNGIADDPEGFFITSHVWTQISGPTVNLSHPNFFTISFVAPEVSETTYLTFRLTVTDDKGLTGSDDVTIQVNIVNSPPSVDAGSDKISSEGQTITLTATADDTDGTIKTQQWLQIQGPLASLFNTDTLTLLLVAPALDVSEKLEFQLTVTDDAGDSISDMVFVTVSANKSFINDTGITECSDYAYGTGSGNSQSNLDCSLAIDSDGDPIPVGQDGQVGRDVNHNDDSDGRAGFSFTKLDANGNDIPVDATEWSCVRDNVTSLIWEVKTNDGDLRDGFSTYTWYNPDDTTNGGYAGLENGGNCPDTGNCDTEKYTISVNEQGLCGLKDWRLPTIEELRSIVDNSILFPGPTIDIDYFPNTKNSSYWSSSPFSHTAVPAWVLFFDNGDDNGFVKDNFHYVRLVRTKQQ